MQRNTFISFQDIFFVDFIFKLVLVTQMRLFYSFLDGWWFELKKLDSVCISFAAQKKLLKYALENYYFVFQNPNK